MRKFYPSLCCRESQKIATVLAHGNSVPPKIMNVRLLFLTIFTVFATFMFKTQAAITDCNDAPVVVGVSNLKDTSAVLIWNAVPNESSPTYTVELYSDAAFTTNISTHTGISATEFKFTGLVLGNTYYYRLKACGSYSTGSFTTTLGYTPISIASGFNFDVIANGVGLASTSTTGAVDDVSTTSTVGYAFVSTDYQATAGATALTYGLPINRNIGTSSNNYLLQSYSANNSLRLAALNAEGTLLFTDSFQLKSVSLAFTGGGGATTVSVDILFTDGSVQTLSSLAVTDWYGSGTTAASSIGRVNRSNGTAESGAAKIFSTAIAISTANQLKFVKGVKIKKTSSSALANIFAVSGQLVGACPEIASASASTTSFTTANINWTLGSYGTGGTALTYLLEVYKDAARTRPISGSPFTGLSTASYALSNLQMDSTYYYSIKASNGTCESAYYTGSFTVAYCVPTRTLTTYYITKFETTNGITNISNSTANPAAYSNYSTQAVSVFPLKKFNFNGTFVNSNTKAVIYVDWNQDLDFDDPGEQVAIIPSGNANYSGSITIPAGVGIGTYRMRIRSCYYSTTYVITPCGNVQYGETEDYSISVIAQPADCEIPDAPQIVSSNITKSNVTIALTAPATAPTGYLIVRSNASTLLSQPLKGKEYVAGDTLGGGTVIYSGLTTTTLNDFVQSNTQLNYFSYSYNDGGITCYGPVYSTAAVANTTSCADSVVVSIASNVTSTSARLNWTSVLGKNGLTPTYTVELYKNAALTALFGTYTTTSNFYDAGSLTTDSTYYYRVKASTTGCYNDAWSETMSFTARSSYTPLSVTGYAKDVVANGNGPAKASINADIDGVGYTYISRDYKLNSASSYSYGLPVNRSISDPNIGGLKYLLGNYSENNVLRLVNVNDLDTLSLTAPVKLTDVYTTVTSGSGISRIIVEVLFTDGTKQTSSEITLPDWTEAGTTAVPAVLSNIGRVATGDGVPSTVNSKIFQVPLHLSDENQSKTVSGVVVKKTATVGSLGIVNVFSVSGKIATDCPSVGTVNATTISGDSVRVNWILGSTGSVGGTNSYTLEVYKDAQHTRPVIGSPFTGINDTVYGVGGLNIDSTYYYQVKVINGSCVSDYVTGSVTPSYCVTTSTYPSSYYISNFSTTNGISNISNSTSYQAYTNYSSQAVSTFPLQSIDYSITFSSSYTKAIIYVDWNKDLDFDDDGEVVATISYGATTRTGTISVPAGVNPGNYRLRVRSCYYSSSYTITPCGSLYYGDTEDYTFSVLTKPENCTTPSTPTLSLDAVTASNIIVEMGEGTDTATGYLLVRSTSAQLTSLPIEGKSYVVGDTLGGGSVIFNSAVLDTISDFVSSNTHYYYNLFAYNKGGVVCYGPIYSSAATVDTTTCAKATTVSIASNITDTSAFLNWTSVLGKNGAPVQYTVEVYTDTAMTNLYQRDISDTCYYSISGLTKGTDYYYRVKAKTSTCSDSTWTSLSTFKATLGIYTPLSVVGFNEDVIANGTGIAKYSTTHSIDDSGNAYVALDYTRTLGTPTSVGLPVNRTLTASSNANLKFLMQDYSLNNSLRLPAQYESRSLTLEEPISLEEIKVALTSGSGTSTISVTVNFTDGTFEMPTSISLLDWYGTATTAQPALISNLGRANRADNNGGVETGNSKIFYVTVPISEGNREKLVSSISVTKTSTGALSPIPNVFAVTGKTIDVCPELLGSNVVVDATEATISWSPDKSKFAATYYNLEVATDAEFNNPIPGSVFSIADTSLVISNLSPLTTYYYRVNGENSKCSAGIISGSFTTWCLVPTAAAQTLCLGSTISDLVTTLETGAQAVWTYDGNSLPSTSLLETGTYYLAQTYSGCTSKYIPVEVTIMTVPAPSSADQIFCQGTTVASLNATTEVGATPLWYLTTDGEALADETPLTTGLYFVRQLLDGCTSVAFDTISVTITTVAEPTVSDQSFCVNDANVATVADLVINTEVGSTATWYDAVGGTPLQSNTELATGTYYVTLTYSGGCITNPASVNVFVTTKPDAPTGLATQTFVSGETITDLDITTVTGASLTWYILLSNGQYLAVGANSPLVDGTTYYVSQSIYGCESDMLAIAVTKGSSIETYNSNLLVFAYPNPTANFVFIDCAEIISEVKVMNLIGQVVKTDNFNDKKVKVDLEDLPKGTYILHATSTTGKQSVVKVIRK